MFNVSLVQSDNSIAWSSSYGELRIEYLAYIALTEEQLRGITKIIAGDGETTIADMKIQFPAGSRWSGIVEANLVGSHNVLVVSGGSEADARLKVPAGTKKNVLWNGSLGLYPDEFNGARLVRSTAQSTTSTASAWSFSSAQIDTHGMWNASNPTRITIPNGVNKIKIWMTMYGPFNAGYRNINIRKNGGSTYVGYSSISSGDVCLIDSKVIDVVSGDYFEAILVSQNATSVYGTDNGEQFGWCMVEIVQ